MSYTPGGSTASSLAVNDLRGAVARWDDEGGAGVTGPQEGYGTGGRGAAITAPRACRHPVEATVDGMPLDQLVRLLFAVSAIRSECMVPVKDATEGTMSLRPARRGIVVPARISRVLAKMIRAPRSQAKRMDVS